MVRTQAMEVEALDYAKLMLDQQAKAGRVKLGTYSSNFPPAAFFLAGDGQVQVAWEFHEDQRFEVLKRGIADLKATAFVLVYDGRVSQMDAELECEACEGKGCEECGQSGKARKGEKRDAIVMVEMQRGVVEPKVTYVPYAVMGEKVVYEKPFTIGMDEPLTKASQHGYAGVWEGAEQK